MRPVHNVVFTRRSVPGAKRRAWRVVSPCKRRVKGSVGCKTVFCRTNPPTAPFGAFTSFGTSLSPVPVAYFLFGPFATRKTGSFFCMQDHIQNCSLRLRTMSTAPTPPFQISQLLFAGIAFVLVFEVLCFGFRNSFSVFPELPVSVPFGCCRMPKPAPRSLSRPITALFAFDRHFPLCSLLPRRR